MNDSKTKPMLSLGDPPGKRVLHAQNHSTRWFFVLFLLQLFTVVSFLAIGSHRNRPTVGGAGLLETNAMRSTAIALEDRGLKSEAAGVWRDYLHRNPGATDRTEVLYRMGCLSMESNDFSQAVTAFVGAEQGMTKDHEFSKPVGLRIIECLRRLGQYGEVGRELSRQTETNADRNRQGNVLATFAGETFTDTDLDQTIERTVDQILVRQPPGSSQTTREQLLKHYESPGERQRQFQEILQRELFSRRARDLKLDREESFVRSQEFVATQLLSQEFLSRELRTIQPTDVDLESYYSTHQTDYRRPESATLTVLPIAENQSAEELQKQILSAEEFRRLANETNGKTPTASTTIVRHQRHSMLGDTEPLFDLIEGDWTKTPLATNNGKVFVLVESKTAEETRPLREVRFQVEADYRQRKQQELLQRLFAELMELYDVKILAMPAEKTSDGESASGRRGVETNP
jgi:hypothetical protein